MRYRLTDFPALLQTPIGRIQFVNGVRHRCWPVLSRLALLHRRTLGRQTRVIAVVGTNGKSTTARAVSAALDVPIHRALSANSWSSLAAAVLRIRPAQAHAVIEAGIGGIGEMAQYARVVQPDVVVVTSIGSEHRRALGNLDVTRTEKAEMLRVLTAAGTAVLNGDDPNVIWMRSQTCAQIVTFGLGESNSVRASHIALDWPTGTHFKLHAGGEAREVTVRLIGQHLVYSILAAVAVALAEGRSLSQILPALAQLPPTPGRLQPVHLPNGAWSLRDDLKSVIETIHAALDVYAQVPARRKFVAMGAIAEAPGNHGPLYRTVGERIAHVASRVIFIGTNFRRYTVGTRRGGLDSSSVVNAGTSVRHAAEILRQELQPGDVVLIKGRHVQHLERITLHLTGRPVQCDIEYCQARRSCEDCPMLERGWRGQRPVT